jgi:hypothetical protein
MMPDPTRPFEQGQQPLDPRVEGLAGLEQI